MDPMPQDEYENDTDHEVITLLRPMRDADLPFEDPAGKGRTFRRRHSVFGVAGSRVVTYSGAKGSLMPAPSSVIT
jgi:hypothetical protein